MVLQSCVYTSPICAFQSQDQYKLCHEILQAYLPMDSFDTYANFKAV